MAKSRSVAQQKERIVSRVADRTGKRKWNCESWQSGKSANSELRPFTPRCSGAPLCATELGWGIQQWVKWKRFLISNRHFGSSGRKQVFKQAITIQSDAAGRGDAQSHRNSRRDPVMLQEVPEKVIWRIPPLT